MEGAPEMVMDPERRFGIKAGGRAEPRSLSQRFSVLFGAIYAGIGVIGFFVTGFGNITEMTDHRFLGIFMINPFHNIVHIALGGLWLIAGLALTRAASEGVNIGIGIIYLLATVLGWMGALTLLSIPSGPDPDQFLHLATGVVTLLVGGGLVGAAGRERVAA
jgi:hypothetical protein